eukprot:5825981-Pleurochrysis_carterae.AAC.1
MRHELGGPRELGRDGRGGLGGGEGVVDGEGRRGALVEGLPHQCDVGRGGRLVAREAERRVVELAEVDA